MTAWDLPTSLQVNGVQYAIRTDFRVVLDVLAAMNDPDLFEPDADEEEQNYYRASVLLQIFLEDYD